MMNPLKSLPLLVCLLAVPMARAADAPKAPAPHGEKPPLAKTVKNVGVEEFAKMVHAKTNVVLDVRTAKEFAAGHIAGAVNLDFNAPDFGIKVGELDKTKTYLVHCAGGVRSAKACSQMSQLNFTNLVNLEPGFKGWEKAGQPVEKK